MAQWFESHRLLNNSIPLPITSLAFDPYSDLLWTGSASGQLTSYYHQPSAHASPAHHHHPHLLHAAPGATHIPVRYTSFPGAARQSTVKEIAIDDRGPVALGERSVKGATRRGLCRWLVLEGADSLSSMCFSSPSSSDIVAGGTQSDMLVINANSGSIVRKVETESPLTAIRSGRLLTCGTLNGQILMRDPRSLRVEFRFQAHPGGLLDMEAEGNLLFSLGYTLRQGHPVPEPLIKVFDIRAMRPFVPIPFPAGPAFLAVHPKLSSTVVVASPQAQFQVVDIHNPGDSVFNQVNTGSYLTSIAISRSGDVLAFGDGEGQLHLWSTAENATFHDYGTGSPPETADVPESPPPYVQWTPEIPLSSIGMPYYNNPLLSSLPSKFYATPYSPLINPPQKIDPAILSSMRTVDFFGYAPLPKHLKGKRNVVTSRGGMKKSKEERRRIGLPLFRSEKERSGDRDDDQANALLIEASPEAVPKYYKKVEIQYSKFGVDDFDFGFYNRTPYSGLETHISNSYANSLLQCLHYLLPFRRVAKAHILSSCPLDKCLLCESGFLSKMLEDAKGVNCQATNWLKVFGDIHQAKTFHLIDKDDSSSNAPYSSLVQSLARFVIEQTSTNSNAAMSEPGQPNRRLNRSIPEDRSDPGTPISQLFGVETKTLATCACGHHNERPSDSNVVEMMYPRKSPFSNEPPPPSDFYSILRSSLARETSAKAFCKHCERTDTLRTRRVLDERRLPPLLAVNTGVHTSAQLEFWTDDLAAGDPRRGPRKRFLPSRFGIVKSGEQDVDVVEVEEGAQAPEGAVVYELRSMVAHIQADRDPPHLVAIIKIPESEVEDPSKPWYLFNDFLVRNLDETEALRVPGPWKVPAVLLWQRVDSQELLDFSSLPCEADPSILYRDISVSQHRDPALIKHQVLSPEELPKPGTLVSIDAEFVAMDVEEVDFMSDGTRSIIRPSRLSLARVSVLRGEGPKEGVPFIDDHIDTRDEVKDYLTQFSGVHPGDLDVHESKHTLVPLKVAYKKLRLLVDLGCVFIGHGLKKDFRIINIFVPQEQVIDTVDLYQSSTFARKLSLRFLAWFLLKREIQGGVHDSIEDAHVALLLYRKYEEFRTDGRLYDVMEDLYTEGRRVNWKPPSSVQESTPATPERGLSPPRPTALQPAVPSGLGSGAERWTTS